MFSILKNVASKKSIRFSFSRFKQPIREATGSRICSQNKFVSSTKCPPMLCSKGSLMGLKMFHSKNSDSDEEDKWMVSEYERSKDEEDDLYFKNLLSYSLEDRKKNKISPEELEFIRERIGYYPSLLDDEDNVLKIIHRLLVPNLMLEPEEEEIFATDHSRYVSMVEMDEKRKASLGVFDAMLRTNDYVSQLCGQEVEKLIDANASNWKEKDCGILLATQMIGADVMDTELVAKNYIIPVLQVSGFEMLKARALWFLIVAARKGLVSITWRTDVLKAAHLMLKEKSNVIHKDRIEFLSASLAR